MTKPICSVVNVPSDGSCFYHSVTRCIIAGILNDEITDDFPTGVAEVLKNGSLEKKHPGFFSTMIKKRTNNDKYQFSQNESLKTALLKVLWMYTSKALFEDFPTPINIQKLIDEVNWEDFLNDEKVVFRKMMIDFQNLLIDNPEGNQDFVNDLYNMTMTDYDRDNDTTGSLNDRLFDGKEVPITDEQIRLYKRKILNDCDSTLKNEIALMLDWSVSIDEASFNSNLLLKQQNKNNFVQSNKETVTHLNYLKKEQEKISHINKNNLTYKENAFLRKAREEEALLNQITFLEYTNARKELTRLKILAHEDLECPHISCLQAIHSHFQLDVLTIVDKNSEKLKNHNEFEKDETGRARFTKPGIKNALKRYGIGNEWAGLAQQRTIEKLIGLKIHTVMKGPVVDNYKKKNEIAVFYTGVHFKAILTAKENTKSAYNSFEFKNYLTDTILQKNIKTETLKDNSSNLTLTVHSINKNSIQYISEKKADIATSIGQNFISHIVGRQSPLVLMNDEQPIFVPSIQLVARDKQNNEIKESEVELKKEQIDYYEVQVTPIAQEPLTEEAAVFGAVESLSEPPEPPKPITLMKIHHDSKITASTDWRSAFSDGLVVDTKKCEEDLIKIEAENKASKLITMAKIMLDTFIQINGAGESDKKKTIRLSGQDKELRQVIESLVTGEPVVGFGEKNDPNGLLRDAIREVLDKEDESSNTIKKYNDTKLYSDCIEIQEKVWGNRYTFYARKERLDFNRERVVVKGPDMVSALV